MRVTVNQRQGVFLDQDYTVMATHLHWLCNSLFSMSTVCHCLRFRKSEYTTIISYSSANTISEYRLDVMDLPKTDSGSDHVVVFQD